MSKLLNSLITLLIIVCFSSISAQNIEVFQQYEVELKSLSEKIHFAQSDREKYAANEEFTLKLKEILAYKNSYKYPFDSLESVGRIVSPDNKFRIINWVLPKQDGTFEYFGFIQSYNKSTKLYELFLLEDHSFEIIKPETKILTHDNWYGALYYKIIYTKSHGRKYYTLLGWDGNNKLTSKKLIEVLTFNSNGKPKFGSTIFKCNKKRIKRYFFEYSAETSISLKYEEQSIDVKQPKKANQKNRIKRPNSRRSNSFAALKKEKRRQEKTKKKKSKMIVFDHLVPIDPNLEGVYQFYIPEVFTYDAFIFENGKWRFYSNVDARNPETPKNENIKPKDQMQLDLFPKKVEEK